MFQIRFGVAALALAAAAAATLVLPTFPLFQEMAKPSEHHKMLQSQAGEYVGTMSFSGPDGEAMSVPATETIKALGLFYNHSSFRCEIPGMPMPFEGWATMGYDPDTEEFVGTWVDNSTPKMIIMRGKLDEETNTLESKWMAPAMGFEGVVPNRMVTVHGEGSYESTFFAGDGEAEVHVMTIAMKRK